MDFHLMDSAKPTFSGTAAPPFQDPYSFSNNPLFVQNAESYNGIIFPCTSLSLMQKRESMEAMRETIFRMAVMQPVHVEAAAPPKSRNVKISKDPQSVAARHRRERISQRIRTLQRMVPGGSKMDTASMLDEAVHYLKFLKKQVEALQHAAESNRKVMISNNGCWSINSDAVNYANVIN